MSETVWPSGAWMALPQSRLFPYPSPLQLCSTQSTWLLALDEAMSSWMVPTCQKWATAGHLSSQNTAGTTDTGAGTDWRLQKQLDGLTELVTKGVLSSPGSAQTSRASAPSVCCSRRA